MDVQEKHQWICDTFEFSRLHSGESLVGIATGCVASTTALHTCIKVATKMPPIGNSRWRKFDQFSIPATPIDIDKLHCSWTTLKNCQEHKWLFLCFKTDCQRCATRYIINERCCAASVHSAGRQMHISGPAQTFVANRQHYLWLSTSACDSPLPNKT